MLAVDRWFDTLTEVDKSYDLRIYETHFIVSISKDKGGEMQEVQTEIRAIPKVTIVRTVGLSRSVGNRVLAKISVKFALLGQESRVKYRDQTLIPPNVNSQRATNPSGLSYSQDQHPGNNP